MGAQQGPLLAPLPHNVKGGGYHTVAVDLMFMIRQNMIEDETIGQAQAHPEPDASQAGYKHLRRLLEKVSLSSQTSDRIGRHRHLMHGDQRPDHADVSPYRAENSQQGRHHCVPLLKACKRRSQFLTFGNRFG